MTRLLFAALVGVLGFGACSEDTSDATPVEGTRWEVAATVSFDEATPVPEGVTASLTIADGTAMVEAGCNTGSGTVEVGDDQLGFGPLAITLMACSEPHADVETVVLTTLSGTVDYEVQGDELTLRRGDGTTGLELVASGG
jgi:heat shock protein HslJ